MQQLAIVRVKDDTSDLIVKLTTASKVIVLHHKTTESDDCFCCETTGLFVTQVDLKFSSKTEHLLSVRTSLQNIVFSS